MRRAGEYVAQSEVSRQKKKLAKTLFEIYSAVYRRRDNGDKYLNNWLYRVRAELAFSHLKMKSNMYMDYGNFLLLFVSFFFPLLRR